MKKLNTTNEAEVQKCESLKSRKKKQYGYVIVGVLTVVLLVVSCLVQISVSNSLTTAGITLAKMQVQIDAEKKENMLLSEQVYSDASYTHIASKAATLGFVEAQSSIFLSNPGPLALKQ